MAKPSMSSGHEWELFLLVVVASQGIVTFLPWGATPTTIVLSYLILLFSVIRQPGRALEALFTRPLVLFIAAWFLAASLLALRPVMAIFLTSLSILLIVYALLWRGTTERMIHVIALATTVSLLPSIVGRVVPIVPVRMHAGSVGGYAGCFPWNSFAGMCAGAALITLVLTIYLSGFAWWHIPAAAGALIMLIWAQSATAVYALGTAAVTIVGQAILRRARGRTKLLAMVSLGIFGVFLGPKAINTFSDISAIGSVVDRSDSLSGRTTIWHYSFKGISESPLWGHGRDYWHSVGMWMNSAHNGFLDVALSGGLPAALAVCIIVLMAGVRLTLTSSHMLPLLAFGVAANLATSQLLIPTIPSVMLWLAVGAAMSEKVGARVPKDASRAEAHATHPVPPEQARPGLAV